MWIPSGRGQNSLNPVPESESRWLWHPYSLTEERNSGLAPAGHLSMYPHLPKRRRPTPRAASRAGNSVVYFSLSEFPKDKIGRGVLRLPSLFFCVPGRPFDPQYASTPLAWVFIICGDGLAERAQLRTYPAPSVRLARGLDRLRPGESVVAHSGRSHGVGPGGCITTALLHAG